MRKVTFILSLSLHFIGKDFQSRWFVPHLQLSVILGHQSYEIFVLKYVLQLQSYISRYVQAVPCAKWAERVNPQRSIRHSSCTFYHTSWPIVGLAVPCVFLFPCFLVSKLGLRLSLFSSVMHSEKLPGHSQGFMSKILFLSTQYPNYIPSILQCHYYQWFLPASRTSKKHGPSTAIHISCYNLS